MDCQFSTVLNNYRDVVILLPCPNAMIYKIKIGNSPFVEKTISANLIPFPIGNNLQFKQALLSLFSNLPRELGLNRNKHFYDKFNDLLTEFNISNSFIIDDGKLPQSCNQWLHILLKKTSGDFAQFFKNDDDCQFKPAILTWANDIEFCANATATSQKLITILRNLDKYKQMKMDGHAVPLDKSAIAKTILSVCYDEMDYMQMKLQNIETYRNNISELISLAQHNLPDDLHDDKDLPALYNILK
ncbi:hypothetical protein [Bartonella sp. HY761]|uniref:hypothetical protein n=1 Tax=Bartonella sp. HY761 TaxID=2979330 RepID=UPI0021F9DAEA|nr:hypothetical protein [Bartonella sp. HY761]UXN06332.1 hypothetical protein N6A79_13855 [Bartonella sp. HY761]